MNHFKKGLKQGKDPGKKNFPKANFRVSAKALPRKVDYAYAFPAIDDQGPFGTCVAFGTGKIFEFFFAKRRGNHSIVSKRAIYSQAKNKFWANDLTDDGLNVSDGLTILEDNYVLETDFPYDTSNFQTCVQPVPDNIKKRDFVEKAFVSVPANVDAVKKAMYKAGPVVIGMDWLDSWESNIGPDGRMPRTGNVAGGHCICLVGYDDDFVNLDGTKGAFHLMNNWSANWGQGGFSWLPYNSQSFPTDVYTIKA